MSTRRPATTHSSRVRRAGARAALLPAAATVVFGASAAGIGSHVVLRQLPAGWQLLWIAAIVWAVGTVVIASSIPTAAGAVAGGMVATALAAGTYHLARRWLDGIEPDPTVLARSLVAGAVAGAVLGMAARRLATALSARRAGRRRTRASRSGRSRRRHPARRTRGRAGS